jgi:hypothetical protein
MKVWALDVLGHMVTLGAGLVVSILPIFCRAVCVHALKRLALLRASVDRPGGLRRSHHSRRLRFTLAVAPVVFAHAQVTDLKSV